ncbi:MAG: CHAT domain-containing protein [Dehalococcoidia bacterium]|uniref:CHAT domain-containing protein n=1 Tax=Candidatus Amarobacter glycogenicus TaxID=3140699 RepID=UPI0031373B80|nr:CHAT domain-containing protein [Dehalococcoidia bacterium]
MQLKVRCDLLVLTGCSTGRLEDDEAGTNEFSGVVRQLMAATGARSAVVSRDPVVDAAGVVFADGLFAALTGTTSWGKSPSWTLRGEESAEGRLIEGEPLFNPPHALPLAEAVAWVRDSMEGFTGPMVENVVKELPARGRAVRAVDGRRASRAVRPDASWYQPWFVFGDPDLRLS